MVVNNFDLSKTLESGQCFHFEKLRDQKYLIYGENSFCVATQEGNNLILETDNYDYWIYYFVCNHWRYSSNICYWGNAKY